MKSLQFYAEFLNKFQVNFFLGNISPSFIVFLNSNINNFNINYQVKILKKNPLKFKYAIKYFVIQLCTSKVHFAKYFFIFHYL